MDPTFTLRTATISVEEIVSEETDQYMQAVESATFIFSDIPDSFDSEAVYNEFENEIDFCINSWGVDFDDNEVTLFVEIDYSDCEISVESFWSYFFPNMQADIISACRAYGF